MREKEVKEGERERRRTIVYLPAEGERLYLLLSESPAIVTVRENQEHVRVVERYSYPTSDLMKLDQNE